MSVRAALQGTGTMLRPFVRSTCSPTSDIWTWLGRDWLAGRRWAMQYKEMMREVPIDSMKIELVNKSPKEGFCAFYYFFSL